MEAFDKVCDVPNAVHLVRCTNWDLHLPTVVWAYRTMGKTLTMQALLKLTYEVDAVIPMEHENSSLRIVAPVDPMVHEAWKEGITQPPETKHIGLEEEI